MMKYRSRAARDWQTRSAKSSSRKPKRPASSTASASPSTANTTSAAHGRIPTDVALKELLTQCWRDKVMVSSNIARTLATAVGIAASCQYITTKVGPLFTRQWHITKKGLEWLEQNT